MPQVMAALDPTGQARSGMYVIPPSPLDLQSSPPWALRAGGEARGEGPCLGGKGVITYIPLEATKAQREPDFGNRNAVESELEKLAGKAALNAGQPTQEARR